MNETRYPLCWPANWKRTTNRIDAQFGKVRKGFSTEGGGVTYQGKSRLSIADAVDRIGRELTLLGINHDNVIVSTNVPLNLSGVPRGDRSEPSDPGAAVYWTKKGQHQCMAIDRYRRVADNLAAIAATLDALRSVERHGGGAILDRAFIGFAQLPDTAHRAWRDVLQFGLATPTRGMIEDRYRELARTAHPDAGGTHDRMSELNAARDAALREVA